MLSLSLSLFIFGFEPPMVIAHGFLGKPHVYRLVVSLREVSLDRERETGFGVVYCLLMDIRSR